MNVNNNSFRFIASELSSKSKLSI